MCLHTQTHTPRMYNILQEKLRGPLQVLTPQAGLHGQLNSLFAAPPEVMRNEWEDLNKKMTVFLSQITSCFSLQLK